MSGHEHVWRRDPYAPVRLTSPPQHHEVCGGCIADRWVSAPQSPETPPSVDLSLSEPSACRFHPQRVGSHEIEGRVIVCAACFEDPEIRTHAHKEWR